MKVMKKNDILDENRMQLLKREIEILRSIKDAHPFVLNLIGVMETQVRMMCVMHAQKLRSQYKHKPKFRH